MGTGTGLTLGFVLGSERLCASLTLTLYGPLVLPLSKTKRDLGLTMVFFGYVLVILLATGSGFISSEGEAVLASKLMVVGVGAAIRRETEEGQGTLLRVEHWIDERTVIR